MQPVLPTVAVTAVQEDIVLATVPMEITIQENLSFFQKSIEKQTSKLKKLNHSLPVVPESVNGKPVLPHLFTKV